MTYEKKCFIKPDDIRAVRIRCTKCGSASIIPIESIASGDMGMAVTRSCAHCRTPSGFVLGTKELQILLGFNELLAGLAYIMQGRGIEYGFEIECDGK